ncbi:sirohydrochlorin chelatase [Salinicoccus sp. ID82-1]|uniref:sirohydrochlorin chelatase n=1 Tax=Salinicoccus sp. ID82-1 TaxID=2820269 RepID=UPI001F2FCA22|nr:sirohydrochlorin chelatase [Salinicoccus sp. ID82-1]MCG1008679.1 sirohydrochlorin chelatase [Salinicoccus sp. ID82-1]
MEQIIVLHGSKDESRNDALAGRLRSLMGETGNYHAAFIESHERSVDQVMERCVRQGHRNFNVVPVLFFSASHYCRDIPRAIGRVRESHDDIECSIAPVLSHHPLMQRFIEKRLSELPEDGVALVMAHGNADYAAADRELFDLLSKVETRRPLHPCMLQGKLSVAHVIPGLEAQYDTFHVIPIALEDGFLTSKMKEAVMDETGSTSVNFTPSVNFDSMLKEIIMDHMYDK